MAQYANLNDKDVFPSWYNLPCPSEFVHGTPIQVCFFAEIQQCDQFLRYRTVVKDRDDKECIVAFYPDSYDGFDFKKLKKGYTLAIMNAHQHDFLDGSHGVRVEDVNDVCVFPAGLTALRSIGSDVAKWAAGGEAEQWKCQWCDAVKPRGEMSRCGQCKVYAYCSKECQGNGWTEKGHKSSCKVLRDPDFMSLLKHFS
ncbi:hypothetical protein Daus18300_013353 [Diaporthe australafricana]|uniref:MYND-type domain-containing protein n=1 Tax=Diaporthe australafricana TaxID=127596 RepID=A0ABR3VZC0_9PEZI